MHVNDDDSEEQEMKSMSRLYAKARNKSRRVKYE